MSEKRRFVLKAPDGRYWKGDSFNLDVAKCLVSRDRACEYDADSGDGHLWPESAAWLIEAGMLTKEYLPKVRYGVKRITQWGVTWPTVEDIPFKVSADTFQGHDRLIAAKIVDGEPVS